MKMTKNDLIICEMKQLDIFELSYEEQLNLSEQLINNVNIKQLENKIHEIILKLSGVGGPCFGADIDYIALDNQKRLELIHQLLYFLDIFKSDVKYFKSEFKKTSYYNIDSEKIYGFLSYTKDLINSIFDYGNYQRDEIQKELKLLEERTRVLDANRVLDINNTLDGLKEALQDTIKVLKE